MSPHPSRSLARRLGVTVLATALTLAACAKLPQSGPVEHGIDRVTQDPNYPEFLPRVPDAGASPTSIVQGFLQAVQAGPDEGFAAARQFLAESVAAAWNPLESIRLYAATRPPEAPVESATDRDSAAAVEVPFEQVASVDGSGRYSAWEPEQTAIRFALSRDALGRWRISQTPEGIILSDAEFASQFRQTTVYYPDHSGTVLVPDVRWFLRPDAPRSIVQAFVAGPPPWLADVVTNPVPPGSLVEHGAVELVGSSLDVRLAGQIDSATQSQRDQIISCLSQSLLELPNVTAVSVWAGTVRWLALTDLIKPPDQAANRSNMVALAGSQDPENVTATEDLVRIDNGQLRPEAGFESIDQLDWHTLTVEPDLAAVAGIGSDKRIWRLGRNDPEVAVYPASNDALAPVYDSAGWLWTAFSAPDGDSLAAYPPPVFDGRTFPPGPNTTPTASSVMPSDQAGVPVPSPGQGGSLSSADGSSAAVGTNPAVSQRPPEPVTSADPEPPDPTDPDAASSPPELMPALAVQAPWLSGSKILALAPAADGARMALMSKDPSGVIELRVAGVVRTAESAPATLTEPIAVLTLGAAPVQMVWADAVTLALLVGPSENQASVPRLVTVGGSVNDLRAPSAAGDPAVGIAVGATPYDIYVATESGFVFSRSGPRWTRLASAVRLLASAP